MYKEGYPPCSEEPDFSFEQKEKSAKEVAFRVTASKCPNEAEIQKQILYERYLPAKRETDRACSQIKAPGATNLSAKYNSGFGRDGLGS